jgi:PQQ enzyme repeat
MHLKKTPFALGLAASVLLAACGGNGAGVTSAAPSAPSTPSTTSAPTITVQPSDQSVSSGQPAIFTVTATGTGTLSYQWQKNAAPIAGATAPIYTTPAAALSDSGSIFAVVVSEASGSTTSRGAKLLVASGAVSAGTDVLTYKNDLGRTGQNLAESTLTPANVTSASFGLLRNLMVDGKVDAQPLYVSRLSVSGSAHNVVYAATEHDSVYAFDADSGSILWRVSLLASGETLSDTHGCSQVVPEIGITSTPVIDRSAGAHGTLYVVAMSKDAASAYHQRLHALDLVTGAELLNGPAEITATYPTAAGGASTFSPGQYEERAALLLLLNGTLYTSWTSHCDIAPYFGWIIAYSASTLSRTAVLNVAPNSGGTGPAIWMSGGGPAADAAGNIYLLTANGAFETALDANGFPKNGDFGNSFLKLSTAGGSLSVADYFTMYNEIAESAADEDLGSGGVMLLPDLTDSTHTVRHLVVGAGKDGNIYVVNRDSMGKFNSSGNGQIWQQVSGALVGSVFSTPAYFNGTVYYGDVGETLKAFTVSGAKLAASPQSQSATLFGFPGTAPAVSANGTSAAIVWAHENSNPAVLHAYDAANLQHELYNSNQAAGNRDQFGIGNKFITPTIADGKVFVGTTNSVAVFGLLQ